MSIPLHDPDELYAFENLWRQYRACRRNKRNTFNALAFEVDAEASLFALQAELRAHTYRPGRSICFISRGAKPREVFAADFRDRVVHHVLVSRQAPFFERRFSHESFACRKGKGTLAASDRLMAHLRSATANGRRSAHALKLDVASFFPSIDKRILDEQISGAMRDPELLWLTRVILFHDPTENYRFRSLVGHTPGPGTPGYPVPERKSRFGKDGLRGRLGRSSPVSACPIRTLMCTAQAGADAHDAGLFREIADADGRGRQRVLRLCAECARTTDLECDTVARSGGGRRECRAEQLLRTAGQNPNRFSLPALSDGAASGGARGASPSDSRIAAVASGGWIVAMIFIFPPQRGHSSTSMAKTRCMSVAQGIHRRAACAQSFASASRSLAFTVFDFGDPTTSRRHPARGANTPW